MRHLLTRWVLLDVFLDNLFIVLFKDWTSGVSNKEGNVLGSTSMTCEPLNFNTWLYNVIGSNEPHFYYVVDVEHMHNGEYDKS